MNVLRIDGTSTKITTNLGKDIHWPTCNASAEQHRRLTASVRFHIKEQ
jgi:hypothetical protein